MTATLRHRGPDDSGCWTDHAAGIALGHRRLAILDLSEEGHQPMFSADGRLAIVFNGEVYNYRQLREELVGRGHRFRGTSDTEVLLAAISEWGLRTALQKSVGMFAFAVWDRKDRRLLLARDRMGEKPLYYGWTGSTFLFGSELKALWSHPEWRGEISIEAMTLFMRHCFVPAPLSIFRGIHKLPPGTFLSIGPADCGRNPEPQTYWSLAEVVAEGVTDPFRGNIEDAGVELESFLQQAVRQQMVADVPLGAFLSGGVDSSTIVALMQAQSDRPVRTFTIGFAEAAFNEAEHAKAVARHLGTQHTEMYVTPGDAMAVIPRLPSLYDEPFADSSQIPTYLVSSLAREHVTVSLSGDGGDELFGGYVRHQLGPHIWRRIGWLPASVRRAAGGALNSVPASVWNFLGTATEPFLPQPFRQRHPAEKAKKLAKILAADGTSGIYEALISSWDSPARAVSGGSEPRALPDPPHILRNPSGLAARMMYLDAISYLPDDILVKVDRAAMGVSLETRVPFLDHRVIEFAWKLPLEMKIGEGEGKRILRRVLYRHVPRDLIERPKMGFGVPVGEWIRGPLRDWAEDLLDERRIRDGGVLEPKVIRSYWREHASGRFNRTFELWCVLMFQAWQQEVTLFRALPASLVEPVGRVSN